MTTLLRRRAEIVIQDVRVTGLRVVFNVHRSLRPTPNKATVKVYNLAEDTRRRIESLARVRVLLLAGYEHADPFQVFFGDLRRVSSAFDGSSTVTTLEGIDGGQARQQRVDRGFAAGTSLTDVIGHTVDALGIGRGNLVSMASRFGAEGFARQLTHGTAVSGRASDELTRLLESTGCEWSIQDQRLQILPRGRALEGEAIRLAAETGLVGSPSISPQRVVTAQTLMIPELYPGRRVVVESRFVNGAFRVVKTEHSGDTQGNDWYIKLEARPL